MRTITVLVVFFVFTGATGCGAHRLAPDGRPVASAAIEAPPASGGTLALHPERAAADARLEAAYRPAGMFVDEPRLHLRARLRTPEDDSYSDGMGSRTVAVLDRQHDGTYRGTFQLPSDVVYAALAVENPSATRTDTREGRFWEVLVHGDDGRPLLAALRKRFDDHIGRDELAVLATAREMVRLYHDHPSVWSNLRVAEGWVLGDQDAETRLASHREWLLEFDRKLAGDLSLSPDRVGYMYWYASLLREAEIAERWRARLLDDHPGQFFAIQEQVNRVSQEYRDDPGLALVELESLWQVALDGSARERVVGQGVATARRIEDNGALLRWAARWVELNPRAEARVANILASNEPTREEGIQRLKEVIASTEAEADEHRPLGATLPEHRARAAHAAATHREALGRYLLAAGRVSEAIQTLEAATAQGWDTRRYRELGNAYLSSLNHERAISAFAAVAADPGTTAATTDSLRHVVGVEPDDWRRAVDRKRAEMVERTLRAARAEPLSPASVTTRDGQPVPLLETFGDQATVVVFWSRYCGPSHQAMPGIAALATRLGEAGIPLLAVTRNSRAEAEEYLREGGWGIDVLYDTEGEAARALNNWVTPQYFVVDGAGMLRYASSSLDALPRQVAALLSRYGGADRSGQREAGLVSPELSGRFQAGFSRTSCTYPFLACVVSLAGIRSSQPRAAGDVPSAIDPAVPWSEGRAAVGRPRR
jgi:phosphoglycolate phosphatase-like HAD superfamily hydrolase